jgi:hypothetical protein
LVSKAQSYLPVFINGVEGLSRGYLGHDSTDAGAQYIWNGVSIFTFMFATD